MLTAVSESTKDFVVSRPSPPAAAGPGPSVSAAAATPSPACLSRRHDRTSPWPSPAPGPGRAFPVGSSAGRGYVQPPLFHYLIEPHRHHHPGAGERTSRCPSTAAGSSSPGSSRRGAGQSATPQQQVRRADACGWAGGDWPRPAGLRPSGAVSFRAVVDADDSRSRSRSSAAEGPASCSPQQEPSTYAAHQHRRLI